MIKPLSDLTGFLYQNALKPALFQIPADYIHEGFTHIGYGLGKIPLAKEIFELGYAYKDSLLEQDVAGIHFSNPVGLSAGFEYTAKVAPMLKSLGFGFGTIGTLTYQPYEGNTPPRLGRLPLSKSLWVNKGLKNAGAENVSARLSQLSLGLPLGISIGGTNRPYFDEKDYIREYVQGFQAVHKVHSPAFWELNISCPNVSTPLNFYHAKDLKKLLHEVALLRLKEPVFVKMPIDTDLKEYLQLCEVIAQYDLTGVIAGNATKRKDSPAIFVSEAQKYDHGAFSGKPTFHRSNERIQATYLNFKNDLIVIGTGGIFNAQDAYYKIKLGASMVQLITGMIYQGPQVVGQINHDLAKLLKQDGFTNVSQAIGIEA